VRLPLAIVVAGTLPPIAGNPVVELGGGVVRVGTGEWAPARWFDPRPRNLTTPDPGRVTAAARVLWEVPAAEIGLDAARAEAAVAALVAGEAEPACKVLGAGPGLTPAGDDVLAGALSACALIGPATALRAAPEFLARARGATTSLSAALLSCAAAGQVIPQAASFLSALCGTGDVASALAELRSIGATSGTALAVGIVAALDSGRTGRSLAVTQ
jgi:hypothetical protein